MRSLNFDTSKPLIYLVATPIGNLGDISPRAIEVIKDADIVACEDTRVTGKLLSYLGISKQTVSLREHNEVNEAQNLIPKILSGTRVVYMSDAGYPCISDPGAKLVKLAIEAGINVSTISGPNAGLNALVASGLPCDHFYFHGFLSPKEKERKDELSELKSKKETLIFYEAPHRIDKTVKSLLDVLGNRNACIARELTKLHEEYIRGTLEELVQIDPETLKGEMVIIVEGCPKEIQTELKDDDIKKLVDELIDNGLSAKDAIKKVSEDKNIRKSKVYEIYHK